MADEYPEVEMSDIEDPTDSSPPPSDYDPSSDSDDSINNLDPESDNDSDGPIEDNPGEIVNRPAKKSEIEIEIESLRAELEETNLKLDTAEHRLVRLREHLLEGCDRFYSTSLRGRCVNKRAKKYIKSFAKETRVEVLRSVALVGNALRGGDHYDYPASASASPSDNYSSD